MKKLMQSMKFIVDRKLSWAKRLSFSTLRLLLLFALGISLVFTTTSCARKEEKVIKIGAILPLTGGLSWFGENAKNALMLLEKEINSSESVKLKVIFYDSKSTPKDGLNAYNKMLLDGIKFAYVCLDPVSKTIIPRIEKDGVLIFVGSVDNEIVDLSPNVFRLYYGFKEESESEFDFLTSMHVKSISMILRDVQVIRKWKAEYLASKLQKNGIEIKGVHFYPADEKDFKNILAKVKEENPEAILISEYGDKFPILFSQMKNFMINPKIVTCGLGFLNVKGNLELYEGAFFCAPEYYGKEKNFWNRYINIYGKEPTYEAYYSYDAVKILYLSIKSTDGSLNKVKDFLLSNTFEGISQKRITFAENRDLKTSVVFKKVEKNKIINYENVIH